MIDGDGLDAFVVFAEHLNFTRAAKDLHISQPALHAKIQRLSERLGVPLYRREGRRLLLTQEGESVARFGREQRARTASFLAELRGEEDTQPVILMAGEGSYLYLLRDGIKAYLSAPEGRSPLRLMTGDRDAVLQHLRHGKAQIGVAVFDGLPDDLDSTLLKESGYVVVGPASHPLWEEWAGGEVPLSALAGRSLVVPPAGRPHRAMIERAMAAQGTPWHVAVEAGGWPLMLQFVSMGIGLAIVNGVCDIPDGLIAAPVPELGTLRYYLLHRPGARERVAVAALCDSLLEGVGGVRGLDDAEAGEGAATS